MGSNVHKKGRGRTQQDRTSLILYGSLIDQYDFEALYKDSTELGRWVHMELQGDNAITMKIVYGYNTYHSKIEAIKLIYHQQQCHLIATLK